MSGTSSICDVDLPVPLVCQGEVDQDGVHHGDREPLDQKEMGAPDVFFRGTFPGLP